MDLLKIALTTFVLSIAMVALTVVGKVVAGDPIAVGYELLPVLALAIWVVTFLMLLVINALRWHAFKQSTDASREDYQRDHRRRERRLFVVFTVLCLLIVKLGQDYLGDELTVSRVVLNLVLGSAFVLAGVAISDFAFNRRTQK